VVIGLGHFSEEQDPDPQYKTVYPHQKEKSNPDPHQSKMLSLYHHQVVSFTIKIFEKIEKKILLSGQQGQEGDGGEAQPQHPRQLIHPR
jgi:hypothetical protein